MTPKLSKLARHIFRNCYEAKGPAPLNLIGVDPDAALSAIREAGDKIRVFDAEDPIFALYVIIKDRDAFKPLSWWDRIWM